MGGSDGGKAFLYPANGNNRNDCHILSAPRPRALCRLSPGGSGSDLHPGRPTLWEVPAKECWCRGSILPLCGPYFHFYSAVMLSPLLQTSSLSSLTNSLLLVWTWGPAEGEHQGLAGSVVM